MEEPVQPIPSKWEKFKRFLHITGTEKGEIELRQFRQILLLAITFIFLGAEIYFLYRFAQQSGLINQELKAENDKNIAVLTIDQQITDEYANNIMSKLDEIRKNKEEFPHLLVIMATPGGSPTGASEIAHYLIDLQNDMNVTMYVQSIAASGGYYIAASAKHDPANPLSGIIAQENAIVGSIGVIMPKFVIKKLADQVGVDEDDITVGKYKKPFSLFEYSTPDEKAYLRQNLLNPAYKNFLHFVAEGRDMNESAMEEYAQGKIFVASEVVGPLVDRISYLSKIKREIQTRLEKQYPDQSVGFVNVTLAKSKSPLFGVELNVNQLSLGADAASIVESARPSMQ